MELQQYRTKHIHSDHEFTPSSSHRIIRRHDDTNNYSNNSTPIYLDEVNIDYQFSLTY